jgi:hypothetical protein
MAVFGVCDHGSQGRRASDLGGELGGVSDAGSGCSVARTGIAAFSFPGVGVVVWGGLAVAAWVSAFALLVPHHGSVQVFVSLAWFHDHCRLLLLAGRVGPSRRG